MDRIIKLLSNRKLKTRSIDDYCLNAYARFNDRRLPIIISSSIKRLHEISNGRIMLNNKDLSQVLSDFTYSSDKNLYTSNTYKVQLSKKEFDKVESKLEDYIDYYNKIVNGD